MNSVQKKDYIQLVCDITNNQYEITQKRMRTAKRKFGVTYKEYYQNGFYDMTPTKQSIEARRIIIRRENKAKRMAKISDATGLTPREIRQKIREINHKDIFHMTILLYAKYEVYRFEGDDLDDFLQLLSRRNQLRDKLRSSFKAIDSGLMSYDDIQNDLGDFYSIIEKLMPESLIKEMSERIQISHPELADDPDKSRKTAVDMDATCVLLPFSSAEYVAFHFLGKTIEERRRFLSDKERLEILNKINDPDKTDMLDNKYQIFELLQEHYGREMICIKRKKDLPLFQQFCTDKSTIVIKPLCGTMGRGIQPVHINAATDTEALFIDIYSEYKEFIAEELISSHKCIRDLNPDSVNTIRLITYYDGSAPIIHDSFMKVGQQHSFVDNGSSGGILVHVNPETGILDSNGCDENGVIYETHPYTGIRFNGYQLPEWEKARTMMLELSKTIPGLKYIGWDITYTSDNQWIIVEANVRTQFYGQQCTTDTGVRDDFLKTVNYIE